MNPLFQILQQVISDSLLPRKSEILQRGAIGITAIALTVALSFIALFFLALSFYSWMGLYTSLHLAALATAGVVILACLIIALITYLAVRSKPKEQPQADEVSQMMAVAASVAGEEFENSINSNPKTTLLLAGIAGFAAAKYLKK
ncbi:hypothetical protein [uncultured Sneathiella sp.]|uniref:hypothetical protein n=1 Tax=uncultured Sneathiella sp. TaxID=879315 RepID=UPI0030D9022A